MSVRSSLVLAQLAAEGGRREAQEDENGRERGDEQEAGRQDLAPVGVRELVGLKPVIADR